MQQPLEHGGGVPEKLTKNQHPSIFSSSLEPQGLRSPLSTRATSKAGKIQIPLIFSVFPRAPGSQKSPEPKGYLQSWSNTYKRPSIFFVFPRAPVSQKSPEPKGYLQSWQNTSAPPCFLCSLESQGLRSLQSPRTSPKLAKYKCPSMFSVFPRAPGSQKSPESKGYPQS
jgi:hypothetical protein